MIRLIKSIAHTRPFWVLLFLLGVILEGCGLYFQYSLHLDPCVNCVYERAFYLSFIIAGLIGFLSPSFILTRLLATLTFFAGSVGGVYITYHHLLDYYNDNPFATSCRFGANFPEFLPLDKYLPWIFKPTGACTPIDWSLLGFSMPQWIMASFVCGTLVAFIFLVSEFIKTKRRDYIHLYH